jgi:hypothetical protein
MKHITQPLSGKDFILISIINFLVERDICNMYCIVLFMFLIFNKAKTQKQHFRNKCSFKKPLFFNFLYCAETVSLYEFKGDVTRFKKKQNFLQNKFLLTVIYEISYSPEFLNSTLILNSASVDINIQYY